MEKVLKPSDSELQLSFSDSSQMFVNVKISKYLDSL
jgi:hypothetical protein